MLIFAIIPEDLAALYLKQEGKCALSGIEMRLDDPLLKPSVDRIDSDGHYLLGNIQIVCAMINIMKWNLKQQVFVKLCSAVHFHQVANEDTLLAAIEGQAA